MRSYARALHSKAILSHSCPLSRHLHALYIPTLCTLIFFLYKHSYAGCVWQFCTVSPRNNLHCVSRRYYLHCVSPWYNRHCVFVYNGHSISPVVVVVGTHERTLLLEAYYFQAVKTDMRKAVPSWVPAWFKITDIIFRKRILWLKVDFFLSLSVCLSSCYCTKPSGTAEETSSLQGCCVRSQHREDRPNWVLAAVSSILPSTIVIIG